MIELDNLSSYFFKLIFAALLLAGFASACQAKEHTLKSGDPIDDLYLMAWTTASKLQICGYHAERRQALLRSMAALVHVYPNMDVDTVVGGLLEREKTRSGLWLTGSDTPKGSEILGQYCRNVNPVEALQSLERQVKKVERLRRRLLPTD